MTFQVSVCPNCGGNGEMISEYCRKCSGEGRIRVKKDIKLKIPPGVNKGSILRVAGEGDAGPKGYVLMNIASTSLIFNICSISLLDIMSYIYLMIYVLNFHSGGSLLVLLITYKNIKFLA